MARTSRKQQTSVKTFVKSYESQAVKPALYARLSKQDNGGKSGDGIENQLECLRDFVKKLQSDASASAYPLIAACEKWETIPVYTDNGQTGTDFERPGWNRMMADAKGGSVNCILLKDLSRFARNYLEAGEYLQNIFPLWGIRLIAVNDQFDSFGEIFCEKGIVTDFQNLANDYYSKDLSKKILSVFRAKKNRGEYIGSKAPYGYYLKDHHFQIDEQAAQVVRRIFAMAADGTDARKIAEALNAEKIPSPAKYAGEQGMRKYQNCAQSRWQPDAVRRILHNRTYIGDLVQGKYNRSIYAKEKRGMRPEDTWEIREGAHPAIVERALYFQIEQKRCHGDGSGSKNMLQGSGVSRE